MKIGDIVYANLARYGTINARQGTVVRLTPSGQAVVDFGEVFAGNQKPVLRRFRGNREIGSGPHGGVTLCDLATYQRLRARQQHAQQLRHISKLLKAMGATVVKSDLTEKAEQLAAMIASLPDD